MKQGTGENLNSDCDSLFSELYRAHHSKMLRIAKYYLSNNFMAEDVVSDVFANLLKLHSGLLKIKNIKNYLFIMLKRRCIDEVNKYCYSNQQDLERVSPRFLISLKNPETTYLNNELAERFANSLQKLPDKCRIVFLLVKEDKLRYREAAELLNISEKTVAMHVGNALKALRRDLEAYIYPHRVTKKSLR